jgi:hypothetical protein
MTYRASASRAIWLTVQPRALASRSGMACTTKSSPATEWRLHGV